LVKINSPLGKYGTDVNPLFFILEPDSTVLRIHKKKYDPIFFQYSGPRGRFDHHDNASRRGTQYAIPLIQSEQQAFNSCLVEVFGDVGIISENDLNTYSICWVKISRRLLLLDLRNSGALKAGSVAALSATPDRALSQEWSRYFYENENIYSRIDGIIYQSAYNGMPTLVLYERAEGALVKVQNLPLNHVNLRANILSAARDLGLAIAPILDVNNSDIDDGKTIELIDNRVDFDVLDYEKFDFLDNNIALAIKNAQQNLLNKKIGYVYSLENKLIEHHPDGSEELIRYLNGDIVDHALRDTNSLINTPSLDNNL
jgi:RES domain